MSRLSKLSKQEIVILIFMAVVIIYGAYYLIIYSPARKSESAADKGITEIREFITDISARTKEQTLHEKTIYAIHAAETEWGMDPFSGAGRSKTARAGSRDAQIYTGFSYSGYLEMARRKIAVVDGVEYEAGDMLEKKGYKVRGISPSGVVIESVPGGKEIKINMRRDKP